MAGLADSLPEVFERLGRVQARRMFGGHGLFHEGRMIGLVVRETLYLKADAESAHHFDALHAPAFCYERQGKTMQMSYREAPADLFDDRELAALWGRRAWEAAMRSGQAPRPRRPKASRSAPKTKKAP
ncbi:TfoX/Sxy family protein [Variovorax sp. ZT4R33]|uniref:TfoX/Sxy family protein n=1 Tax=Variovorax sp. ZT4R33 TaxID=3443743 RepID=UPI003F48A659